MSKHEIPTIVTREIDPHVGSRPTIYGEVPGAKIGDQRYLFPH